MLGLASPIFFRHRRMVKRLSITIYISSGIYTPIFSGPNRNIGVDQEHLYIDVDQYTNNNSE
jgi:hypothetical protein